MTPPLAFWTFHIYDDFPHETIESSPYQQEEAPTTRFEIHSDPSPNLVVEEPPIEGTYHTFRNNEPHPLSHPFQFEDDLFLDVDHRNTLEPTNSTSYALNSWMRQSIPGELIEGEPLYIEDISNHTLSMSTPNVSSNSVLELREDVMSMSTTIMTYPNLVVDMDCHVKESTLPRSKDFIDKHESYFLTMLIQFFFESYYICNITCICYSTFLLHIPKIIKRVVVDIFINIHVFTLAS